MPDSVVIISIALGAIVAAAFLMAGLGYAAWRFGKGLGVSTRRSLSSRRPDRVGPTIVLVEETEDPEALDELAKNWRKATPPWRQRIRRLGIMLLGASILCNVAAAVVVLEQSISIEDEIVAYATRQAVAEEALRAAIGTVMSDPSALDPTT